MIALGILSVPIKYVFPTSLQNGHSIERMFADRVTVLDCPFRKNHTDYGWRALYLIVSKYLMESFELGTCFHFNILHGRGFPYFL